MEKKINGLRFIVGSGCNYDCFYCHHEGYKEERVEEIDDEKLEKLFEFAEKNSITSISITGGEPFLYWNNVKKLLDKFKDKKYNITLNSNFSVIDKYYDELKKYENKIEFHVNLSSINKNTHEKIIKRTYLEKVLNNLEMFKDTHHKICLNILAIKSVNDKELPSIFEYAIANDFLPRILVMMPMTEEDKKYLMSIDEILDMFTNVKIGNIYAHGLYEVSSNEGNFQILKTVCAENECEICKNNTFMHIVPSMDIKYCLKEEELVSCNYKNINTIENSFEEAQKKLEKRVIK